MAIAGLSYLPSTVRPISLVRGLPIGIQLAATHGAERTLLELALELEAAKPFRAIHGPLRNG